MSPRAKSLASLLTTACLALGVAALGSACQGESAQPDESRSAELESLEGARAAVDLPADFPPEEAHALAQLIESQTEAQMVKVKMAKGDSGSQLVVELFAPSVDPTALEDAIAAQYPQLAGSIDIASLEGGPAVNGGGPEFPPDATPEEIEAQVKAQLAEQGVDGEVEVIVNDGPEGREVEVKVKKKEG